MIPRFLPFFLTAVLSVVPLAAQQAETVKVSPQSIEFFLPAEGQKTDRLLTVRLHMTPNEGYSIRTDCEPQQSLECTDAKGNKLQGKFREWEMCFNSTDSACRIAVYDFAALPQGGKITFDTTMEVPITCGYLEHEPVSFDPHKVRKVKLADTVFYTTPSAANESDPDNTAFTLEYTRDTSIVQIGIGDAANNPLDARIVDTGYNETDNLMYTTFALHGKHTALTLNLRTRKQKETAKAAVKFRATIGR